MSEIFQIKPSRSQSIFLVCLYSLTLVVAFFYIDSKLSLALLLGLILLFAIIETRNWRRQQSIRLKLNPEAGSIEFEQADRAQIYDKYKVYTSRWFAILQLLDNQENRNLLLNSDRFKSVRAYQDFRFLIQEMDRNRSKRGANAA